MTTYRLTKHILTALKETANRLPLREYEVINQQPREWKRRVVNFLAPFWLTGWFSRWYYYKYIASRHNVNHYRRLRHAYQANGVTGVVNYLRSIGMQPEDILREIVELEQDKNKRKNLISHAPLRVTHRAINKIVE